MRDEHLAMPFQTSVLGVEVIVTKIDLTDDAQVVAVCVRGRWRQRIELLDLPLSTRLPEWIEAYRV
jgi:hypothetical protein